MSRISVSNAIIALLVAALTLLLRDEGFLTRLENQAADTRATVLTKEVASDIVIVGIDARSIAALHSWPWPRRTHAELLQRLRAADPEQVFLDIDFSSTSVPEDDALLQAEMERWPQSKLVLPTFFQPSAGNDSQLLTTRPLPGFARSARLGVVNQLVDKDGLIRHFRTSWEVDSQTVPSIPSMLTPKQIEPDQIRLIDYSISPSSFSYLSYLDVLNGDFDPKALSGKTVLVGATASELNDMLSVPRYQSLAGCIVQALAVQTLISGTLHSAPDSFYVIGLILFAVACMQLFSRRSWRINLLLLGLSIGLSAVATTALYAYGHIAVEIIPWTVSAILCWAVITIRSLDHETLRALTLALGIRRRDALMASIVESSIDGIFCIDHQGLICAANPAGAKLLDNDTKALLGAPIGNFILGFVNPADARELSLNCVNDGEAAASTGRRFPIEYSVCKVGLQEHQLYTVILRDISDRKAQERKLHYQAMHDSLTTLPNRAAMAEHLERVLSVASADKPVALMMLDLCRFKEVNDTLGHNAGDAVLREVAQRFRNAVAGRGLLARIGGDEFMVIVDTQADTVESLAKALSTGMVQPFHAGSDGSIAIELSVSIGIALFPRHAGDAQSLVKNADIAMYTAKRHASHFEYYDVAYDEHSVRRLTMAAELRGAIANDELQLFYQPQVNLYKGCVESAEALLRWQHPRLGDVTPTEFIAVAESTDLIQPLTHWTLRKALQQIAAWKNHGVDLRIAVNLSARMLQDVAFPAQLQALLESSGVAAHSLELEITESAMMLDAGRALNVIKEIHALGVVVSIDDYGTGFSSLGYLRDLPIHALKLDKSFVLPMRERADDRAIVESTVQLAHALQLVVVAEGVETQWHAEALAAAGYDYAQGYYFSRALDAQSFLHWLQSFNALSAQDDVTIAGVA